MTLWLFRPLRNVVALKASAFVCLDAVEGCKHSNGDSESVGPIAPAARGVWPPHPELRSISTGFLGFSATIILKSPFRRLGIFGYVFVFAGGREQRSQRHAVTDQQGLDITERKNLPGRKNESLSAVTFYPLRATAKPLHPPPPALSFPPPRSHNLPSNRAPPHPADALSCSSAPSPLSPRLPAPPLSFFPLSFVLQSFVSSPHFERNRFSITC